MDAFLPGKERQCSFKMFELAQLINLTKTRRKCIGHCVRLRHVYPFNFSSISSESKFKILRGKMNTMSPTGDAYCKTYRRQTSNCHQFLKDVVRIEDVFSVKQCLRDFSYS